MKKPLSITEAESLDRSSWISYDPREVLWVSKRALIVVWDTLSDCHAVASVTTKGATNPWDILFFTEDARFRNSGDSFWWTVEDNWPEHWSWTMLPPKTKKSEIPA